MRIVRNAAATLVALFIDDGALAIAVLALIGVIAAAVEGAALPPLIGSLLLLVGCIVVLLESVHRAARARPPS
jgi:hypothetical protein